MWMGIGQADFCSTREISQAVGHLSELKNFQKKLKSGNPPCFSGPMPAVWPLGRMLSFIGGPCLSQASWSALQ